MKLKTLKIMLPIFLLLSSFNTVSETKFYSSIKVSPVKIRTTEEVPDKILDFKYFTEFDETATGSGILSADNKTISKITTASDSRPTFVINRSETNEIRVKFKPNSNNAIGLGIFNNETNKRIVLWYDDDKNLYRYNEAGVILKKNAVTSSNYSMEIRINLINNELSFLSNDIIVFSETLNYNLPDSFVVRAFEGSYTKSSVTLL